ncbi:MAG: histidinol-phosphatase [Actinobacteria bacterium HGW-Actinobacteria-6]|jgi:histidinol-phosphatase (PHP family)|nr:MAG: histidinol-phosphatase [Actinobacteria bacterium HGW-Actinobacteria-6]
MIDLHVHTWHCRHAEGTVSEYVAVAAERGLSTIAITDHLPLPPQLIERDPSVARYSMPESELPDYVAEVLAAREASAASGGPEVLLGIEADLYPGNEEFVRSLITQYPFDVVLGSVHFVDGWAFDDPDRKDGYAKWEVKNLWERYFDDLIVAAHAGLADVIGHADLVKKFGYVPEGDVLPLYRSVAAAFALAGVAVEVNTAGLRKPCAELYPSAPFLKELFNAGVPVTIGSDAHAPIEVASAYDDARGALIEAGYRSAVVFRAHRAEEVPL